MSPGGYFLVPCHGGGCPRLIRGSGTPRWNLRVPDLRMRQSDLTTGALIFIFYTWIWTYWFQLYITHWCMNFDYNQMDILTTFYCTMYVLFMYVFLCIVVFIFWCTLSEMPKIKVMNQSCSLELVLEVYRICASGAGQLGHFGALKYRKISTIRRTKSPNLNVSGLVLQLSWPNPVKPGVKSRMKM